MKTASRNGARLCRRRAAALILRRILSLTLTWFVLGSAVPARCSQEGSLPYDQIAAIEPCAALVTVARTNQISLDGIGPTGRTNAILPGDFITALVEFVEKGGRKNQWLLHVQAVPPLKTEKPAALPPPLVMYCDLGTTQAFQSLPAFATLRTLGPYSDTALKPGTSKSRGDAVRVALNAGWLGLGLDQAAVAVMRVKQAKEHGNFGFRESPYSESEIQKNLHSTNSIHFSPAEQRALAGTLPAMMSYFGTVQNTPDLEPILYKLVEKPSLWSYLAHGVLVNFSINPEKLGTADPVKWGLAAGAPAYYLPIVLSLNNRPALNVTFVVTAPRPPLLLCSGVVGLIAERPGDNNTRLIFRVISAHCAGAAP